MSQILKPTVAGWPAIVELTILAIMHSTSLTPWWWGLKRKRPNHVQHITSFVFTTSEEKLQT